MKFSSSLEVQKVGDRSTKPVVAMTVAGFDPSSGAGVTADLAVFAAHGIFGTSAITALTVQSTRGVAAVQPVAADWLTATIEDVAADMPPAGMKIGMLGSEANVSAIAAFLRQEPRKLVSVFDPVLCSSSGHELVEPAALRRIQTELLPAVEWVTPNWQELATLSSLPVRTMAEAAEACRALGRAHPELHIVATGGDQNEPVDLLHLPDGRVEEFRGERVETTSTHGTGCAFSSALLCRLILGDAPAEAVAKAKTYVAQALRSAPGLGHGRGPLDLLWPLRATPQGGC